MLREILTLMPTALRIPDIKNPVNTVLRQTLTGARDL